MVTKNVDIVEYEKAKVIGFESSRHVRAVMHVGIGNRGDEKNVPSIPGACATHNFTHLVRGPCSQHRVIQYLIRARITSYNQGSYREDNGITC